MISVVAGKQAEETYEDMEKLIHKVTHIFMKKKNISEYDYDEWHGEACQAFVGSLDRYDPSRGRYTTLLWHSVWYSLADKLGRDAVHFKTHHYDEGEAELIEERRSLLFGEWNEKLEDLSADSRVVVELVVGGSGCFDGEEHSPAEVRLGLYEMLTALGWSFGRVIETFREIREAITE